MIMKTRLSNILGCSLFPGLQVAGFKCQASLTKNLKALLPLCLIAFSACEKDVEFDGPAEEATDDIVINAVAVEGEPLRVFLNHAYPIDQQPVQRYIDYQHAMFTDYDYLTDYRSNSYYKNTSINNAQVTAIVNDSQSYQLTLDMDSIGFVCDYRPKANDHIVLKAISYDIKVVDEKYALQENTQATAETTVPAKPKIEVVKYEVLQDSSYYEVNQLTSYADTIMRITCRIDDAGGNQYYRLRIRGERIVASETWYNPIYGRPNSYNYYLRFQDVYFSDDPLFVDPRLNKNFGGWPAYFSNVFDNAMIKGKDYTFVLESPKPSPHFVKSMARDSNTGDLIFETKQVYDNLEFEPRVMVELEAISPEYYRYLKSVELYRVTESDAFSEPVQIYSNVKQGWGIFGSMSTDRLFIEYD